MDIDILNVRGRNILRFRRFGKNSPFILVRKLRLTEAKGLVQFISAQGGQWGREDGCNAGEQGQAGTQQHELELMSVDQNLHQFSLPLRLMM